MASVTSLGVHEPAGLRFAIAEHILPSNPSPDLYSWEVFADEHGDDELFTTATCVVWSRGGEVGRCLKFDMEKETISKALMAYFPASEDDVSSPKSNSDSPKSSNSNSTPLTKSLVVFLRTQAHVYSFSGGDHVVHMPFEVESACAAPRGVIIQRKSKRDTTAPISLKFPRAPPNSFVASQILPLSSPSFFSSSNGGGPKPMPLRLSSAVDTTWDIPLDGGDGGWPRLVCLTDPMLELGLVVARPDKQHPHVRNTSFGRMAKTSTSFLDPAEEILHVESIPSSSSPSSSSSSSSIILAVTVNRETSMYSVWRLTYLEAGDQLIRHHKKPTQKGTARRRSSMQPGAPPPFRESLGDTLPVKKTRKSERIERMQRGKAAESQASLAKALEPDGAAEASIRSGPDSFREPSVDGLLEELRSGGDFEGFDRMGLDDAIFDGLAREMVFTKIRTVPMNTTNLRYSLSNVSVHKMCKVFVVVGTPYAVDEHDRNYLLVCIQDTMDKRLQLLTLHMQRQTDKKTKKDSTSVTWGQLRIAPYVADSCKIVDGGQAMIFILSEGEGQQQQQRQLSIQAPWSELTALSLPRLSLHNANLYSSSTDTIFETPTNQFLDPPPPIARLCHPRGKGVVDVVDEAGRYHQIQIQMEPRTTRVRNVLHVLRSILPASQAEKTVAGWWHIMQWLGDSDTTDKTDKTNKEWTALVMELLAMYLALLREGNQPSLPTNEPPVPLPRWTQSKAWSWIGQTGTQLPPALPPSPPTASLSREIELAKRYMASPSGQLALGYLPTTASPQSQTRKTAAWGILMALHLYLEEEKLDVMTSSSSATESAPVPATLNLVVCQLATWLQWHVFAQQYALSFPDTVVLDTSSQIDPSLAPAEPDMVPCLSEWIRQRLTGQTTEGFPSLADVYIVLGENGNGDRNDNGDRDDNNNRWSVTPRTNLFRRFFELCKPNDSYEQMVEAMYQCGLTRAVLDSLPEGLTTPFQDAIRQCQPRPPSHWSRELFALVGRGDVNAVLRDGARGGGGGGGGGGETLETNGENDYDYHEDDNDGNDHDNDDFMNAPTEAPESEERQAVIQALFREDKRLLEAQTLLSSAKPRVVRLDPQPDWTEPEYLEQQKELVTTVATSTLATPAGRGMLHYGFRFPLLTQKFHVQGFNLTCVVQPTNVVVGVDKLLFTEEKVNWAFFHQGVAYGLAISTRARGIDTSWIVFNKPVTDLSHRHAGFLLALGLNGHLKSVAKWVAFKYLTPKHMMTSIGLLLGLAVSHLGTMDSLITRLLSVHVTRMLPRGAAELNLSHPIQTTGIMGLGLLYYNSQHRRMSEIMLSEIAYLEDEDDEDPLRNEGYRLAAGFSLGLINLAKGNGDRKGLLDLHMTEQLLRLAAATKDVERVHVLDRSAAAATVALALMYLKTEDRIVARKIDVPSSVLQFDYVRPDILLLRTLAKNLILWSSIDATFDWVAQSLPPLYRPLYLLDHVTSLQSCDLPFFAILAGLCFAAALRFAGSANTRVRDLLVHYLDRFLHMVQTLPAPHFDAQTARSGARMCLDVLALSCATVMAGTGDLVVLRRLRALHGRDDGHTTYGSHMAAHLAVGALFLGSGTTTLSNSNLAVAALVMAFYPLFPTSIQDNGAHLQAFRHFWVLAADPRCLVTKDAATGKPVSVSVRIELKPNALSLADHENTILARQTPCLLPPLDDIRSVRTDAAAQGFWDLTLDFEQDPTLRQAFATNQSLFLRRRPVHASAFATTLKVLGSSSVSPTSTHGSTTLDWLFALPRFQSLTRAERARLLDPKESSSSSEASSSSPTDVRLALESNLAGGWRVDPLLDLRLLFGWADHRMSSDKDDEETDWWMGDSAMDMLKGKAWMASEE